MKNYGANRSAHLLQWVEIDLSALKHNIANISETLNSSTRFMAVVKKNAYGCGAVQISRAALEAGADYLAVNSLEEALELRKARVKSPLLILGAVLPDAAEDVIKNKLIVTVTNKELANALNIAGQKMSTVVGVHVKIDCGLHRFGLDPSEIDHFMDYLKSLLKIKVIGLYTHFSSANETNEEITKSQFQRFLEITRLFPQIDIRHAANSAATLRFPYTHLDLVRVGISLYGIYPSAMISKKVLLRPVLSLKTRIIRVHSIKIGEGLSYGLTWIAPKDSIVALIPFGYGHGIPRLLSNCGEVLIKGRRAMIRGAICMDQSIVDVTDIPGVRVGDEATLIGIQGDEQITVEEIAKLANTITYEIITRLPLSLPRLFLH